MFKLGWFKKSLYLIDKDGYVFEKNVYEDYIAKNRVKLEEAILKSKKENKKIMLVLFHPYQQSVNERLKDFMKIEAIQEMINEKTIYVDYDDDYRGLGDIGLVNRIDFHPTIVFLDSNGKVLYKPITKIDGADDLKRLLKQIK